MSKDSAIALATGSPMPQVPEGAVAQAPQQPKPEMKSDPFLHLAKKEEQIVKDRQAFKAEREQFEKDRQIVLKAKQTYEEYLQKKQSDPVEALKMLGFSETDIFNYMANAQPEELTTEQRAIKAAEFAADAKIKAFQDGQTQKEQAAKAQYNASVIQGYRNDIKNTLQANTEQFEYCSYYGKEAQNLAYDIAREVVVSSKGKDFVSASDALEMVEEYFEERDREMAKLKKRQAHSQIQSQPIKSEPVRTRTLAQPPAQSNQLSEPKQSTQRSRTLHNGATSTIAATRITRNETKEQKRDRLIEALRNGAKL